ncbi:MAG: response regulator [Chloroflexota bacterium]
MLTVLYIDDDDVNRDLVKRILARAPFEAEMREADNGVLGVEMAIENPPDLILMDFHMPGITGTEATKQLCDHEATANVPIIALTADIYARERFQDVGCAEFLTKPIRKRALLHTIQKVFPELVTDA